jgi:glycosyltransferase involved in cell wall biosynthesis
VRLVLKGSDKVYDSGSWIRRWWQEKLTPAERSALNRRVIYMGGALPFRALAELYRAADVYVTPYRSESFNLPALEAAASGLPLICTEGGPTDEYTTADFSLRVRARLAPKPGREPEEIQHQPDLDELTDAMLSVVENDAFRERARIAGPAHVGARYTWNQAVAELLAVLRN